MCLRQLGWRSCSLGPAALGTQLGPSFPSGHTCDPGRCGWWRRVVGMEIGHGHWRTLFPRLPLHSFADLPSPGLCTRWRNLPNQPQPDASQVMESVKIQARRGTSLTLCLWQLPPKPGPHHSFQPRTTSAALGAGFHCLHDDVCFPPFPLQIHSFVRSLIPSWVQSFKHTPHSSYVSAVC